MFKNYKNTIFEKNILPAIPPKANLSPNSSVSPDQLGKIPGKRNDQGFWTGFPDWSNHQTCQLELDMWSGWEANVCLRAGDKFFFLDIDIEDPVIIKQLHEFAVNMLGAAPIRGRMDSNRITLLFAQSDHIGKQALKFANVETGEIVGIDVIGSGGQSAIHGIHPKGSKYVWDTNPYEYGALTQVTSSRVEAFLRACISYLETQGYKLTSGRSTATGGVKGDVQARREGSFDVNLLQSVLPRDLMKLIKEGPQDGDRSSALATVMNRLIRLELDDNQIADILLDPTNAISSKPLEKGIDWVMTDIARFRAKKPQEDGKKSSEAPSKAATSTDDADLLRDVKNLNIDSDRDTIADIIDRIVAIKDIIFKEQLLQQVAMNTGLGKRNVNRIVKQRKADSDDDAGDDDDMAKSHRQITDEFRVKLLTESIHVVCSQGLTYFYDPETSMWEAKDMTALVSMVSKEINAQPNFMRGSDYNTVAKLLAGDVVDDQFFSTKRYGFVGDDGLKYEPNQEPRALTLDDRARATMNAHPEEGVPTEFLAFLDRAFEGTHKETQLLLVQEIFGAVLCGMMPNMQIATMILGPGRTGKSTLIEILQAFFPRNVITSIAPYEWTNEYYLAAMSQSWINFISDLDSERKINGGVFKQVMDRSPLTARFPAGTPFQFINHAAQIFIGNETPFTNDQSTAFTRRWVVLEMNNVISEEDIDYHFADRLVETELGKIMMWAMRGAERVIEQNGFTHCPLSDALKYKWMADSNSALMFIQDDEVFNHNPLLKTQFGDMFNIYKAWCKQSGYRPFGKKKFYEILRSTGRVYVKNRIEFFIGTGVNSAVFSFLGLYASEMYGDTPWDALKNCGPLKDEK